MEYYVKRINAAPSTFEISKFDESASGDAPLEVYRVFQLLNQSRCECMAWRSGKRRPCKHEAMVEEFKAAGEPQPFLLRR